MKSASLKVVLAVLLLSGPGVAAQSAQSASPKSSPSPATKAPREVDSPETDEALNLTQDQKDKIKAIRDDAQQQILAAQKDKTASDEQKQVSIKKIRKTERAQVFGVLTPEQQKTWAEQQRERREARKQTSAPH